MYRFILITLVFLLPVQQTIAQQKTWIKKEASLPGQDGQKQFYQLYHDGDLDYVKIEYPKGSTYQSFSGRILPTGDIACGRFLYSNGSIYEGFVYKGKFFGPGKLSGKDGTVQQGIWKLDSLSMPMPIQLPAALFEPGSKTDFDSTRYYYSNNLAGRVACRFYDAGEGWVLGMNRDNIVFGKTNEKTFEGPALWISRSNPLISSVIADNWLTYRTGIFKNGMLYEGTRIRDYIRFNKDTKDYSLFEYTITEGQFLYDMIANTCGTKTFYVAAGRPYRKLEGFFEKDNTRGEETALGWMYINDWTGLRQPENLKFYYENQDLFNGSQYPGNWYVNALQKTGNGAFCFPSMQLQSAVLAKRLGSIADSVLLAMAKEDKRIEDSRRAIAEANKKNAEEYISCLQMLKKNGLRIGLTITNGVTTGIVKEIDCKTGGVTLVVPTRTNEKNKTAQTFPASLFGPMGKWKTAGKQFSNCPKCKGTGGEEATYVTSKTKELPFGYFSGILTTVTKTKTETFWEVCEQCGGTGLTLQ